MLNRIMNIELCRDNSNKLVLIHLKMKLPNKLFTLKSYLQIHLNVFKQMINIKKK